MHKHTTFKANENGPKKKPATEKKPPKKQTDMNVAKNNMLLYSAKKNKAKNMDEYSTLYPATNSASASGRSKGILFVSARPLIKNNIKKTYK